MAESLGFIHFGAAAKSPLAKPKESKKASQSRPQSSRDHQPPPPKKVRTDEKSLKPKKLNGDGGAGVGVNAGAKQEPSQTYSSPTTWSIGHVKATNPSAPHQKPPIHKVFKQSDFLLSSPAKLKKTKKKRDKEKERDKKKHKPPGPGTNIISLNNVNVTSPGMKRENGEVKLVQKDHHTTETTKERENKKDKEKVKDKEREKEKKKHKAMNEIKRENGEVKLLQKGDKEKPKINSEELADQKGEEEKEEETQRSGETEAPQDVSQVQPDGLRRPPPRQAPLPLPKGDFKPPLPIQNNPPALPKQDKNHSPSSKTPSRDPDLKPPQAQCSYPGLAGMEFSRLVHVEEQPNGGALVAHAYNRELEALTPQERQRFAQEFVTLTFSEDQAQAAHYVMGIVHGAACYLPDFLDYFSCKFPTSHVKMEDPGEEGYRDHHHGQLHLS
ncbi:lysine-specific demethylase RSBN1L-like, partial [Osmerus eperlanus]|uniref:lysine-specific demethylase RSBN1L-like n=1 Tax=Osmerus eperlanus TaxID=29151 RepID=UPI002E15FDCA